MQYNWPAVARLQRARLGNARESLRIRMTKRLASIDKFTRRRLLGSAFALAACIAAWTALNAAWPFASAAATDIRKPVSTAPHLVPVVAQRGGLSLRLPAGEAGV